MLLDMPLSKIFDLRKMSSFVAFKGQKNQKQLSFLTGMKWKDLQGRTLVWWLHFQIIIFTLTYKVYTFLKLIGVQSNHNVE